MLNTDNTVCNRIKQIIVNIIAYKLLVHISKTMKQYQVPLYVCIYIYIYMWMCICVCVCMYIYIYI